MWSRRVTGALNWLGTWDNSQGARRRYPGRTALFFCLTSTDGKFVYRDHSTEIETAHSVPWTMSTAIQRTVGGLLGKHPGFCEAGAGFVGRSYIPRRPFQYLVDKAKLPAVTHLEGMGQNEGRQLRCQQPEDLPSSRLVTPKTCSEDGQREKSICRP